MFRQSGLQPADVQALFNASPNAYVLLDSDTVIRGANAAYLRATSRTLDELLGRSMFDAFPSDPASVHGRQLRESLARVLRTGVTDHVAAIRYPIVDEQGQMAERVWSATHIPLRDADGQVTHVLQHTEDITHLEQLRALAQANDPTLTANVLRRAEASQATIQALASERAHLRGIFEQAPGFAAVLRGPDHVYEIANAAYADLVGGGRQLIGRTVREALPELEPQGFLQVLDAAYQSGEAHVGRSVPVWLRRGGSDLEQRHVDFVIQPVRDGAGQVLGIFVQGHDLSAQVEAERRADVIASRFDSLAHTMPLQVWTARPDGRVDWCNDRMVRYAGDPARTPVLDSLAMTHPDERAAAAQAWAQAVQGGHEFLVELRLRRHDGAYRWHLVHAIPVRDRHGNVLQYVGSNTDIDDQKAGAALLTNVNAELARRVEERSAELLRTQEQLRHSQQLEAIGSLAGGIAHEFNNLLQVIGGNLELLSPQLPGPGIDRDRLDRARQAVQRGADLAGQLLAYGRRQPLRVESVDLAALIANLGELLRRTLGEGIEIRTSVAPDLWPTLVDPGLVEIALLNLVLNGRDAMDGHGVLGIELANVEIDAAAADQDELQAGCYVAISVSDTGHGMAPDVSARAFEPFFTTKPRGQGSGLGLSMVFGFARQSGGHVRLWSEPGQGTLVRLYLPRSPVAAVVSAAPVPAPERRSQQRHLLVVEDDPTVRQTLVDQLLALGHVVRCAGDAPQALALLQADPAVDLLLSDVVMPGGTTGMDLAAQVQQRWPGIAVLLTSGYPEQALRDGGRLTGGHPLLSKPYTRAELVAAIDSAIVSPRQRCSVLICEDDELVRESVAELVTAMGCDVRAVATAGEARRVLASQACTLLITDLRLPDGDGLQLAIDARQLQPRLEVVFSSGRGSREAAHQLPRARHLEKPFGIDDLQQLLLDLRVQPVPAPTRR